MRIWLVSAATAASVCVSSTGYCWGQKGHQMVNEVAVSLVSNPQASRFLRANQKQVVSFAVIPDTKWKSGDPAVKEKPMHWFQMDRYDQNPLGEGVADLILGDAKQRLGAEYVTENGLAMWRFSDFFNKLVVALRAQDWEKSVQIAGVMGHYMGDMTQPMHATADYDGQSINKPGIHKYYETTLVDRLNADSLRNAVLTKAGPRRTDLERVISNQGSDKEIQRLCYREAGAAFAALTAILDKFDQNNTDDQWLAGDLQPRIALASALLAKVWDIAFVTAGVQAAPNNAVNAKEPQWIPMN